MPEMDEERERDRDALYRGIGRFLVSFSQLMGHMESGIISIAGVGRGQAAIRAWQLGLTGIEAKRMLTLFFGAAATAIELTSEEKRIHKELYKAVDKLIPLRNAFAHGTWILGRSSMGGPVTFKQAYLVYAQPHYVTGTDDKDKRYTAEQLETLCDEVDEVRDLVRAFASGCAERPDCPRVGDRLELVSGKVRHRSLDGWMPPWD